MSTTHTQITIPQEFSDIAPYNNENFHAKLESLVEEPGFEHAVRYVLPSVDYAAFKQQILSMKTQEEFQSKVMAHFLETLASRTTSGLSIDGVENIHEGVSYTFISNHRDIVLDATFLNLCFIRNNLPITQIAIGNNLLIYEWIADLVKINRSFIVKRDVKITQALEAAKQLSGYIHFTINKLHESIWIAQREGRAKDSNDMTQESLIKMLSLGGGGSVKENVLAVNLCPVSISYERDPNDYLKVREYLMRRRDPEFKKSQRDDLFSMETGMLSFKGHVHFHIGECINAELERFESDNRTEIIKEACRLIDKQIHSGYRLYPCNYIAYDQLNHTDRFANKYTAEDVDEFNKYVSTQLDKVNVGDITPDERSYMYEMFLGMYANPVKNNLQA